MRLGKPRANLDQKLTRMSPRRRPATAGAVLIKARPSLTPVQTAENQTPTRGMTVIKINSAPRASLAAVVAAFASFAASGVMAQSGGETIWLECREGSRGFNQPYAMANNVLAVSNGGIVLYNLKRSGEIERWADLCTLESAACRINEDEIDARFFVPAGRYILNVNRRTGTFRIDPPEEEEEPWIGQCRRIEDPRPPAAF